MAGKQTILADAVRFLSIKVEAGESRQRFMEVRSVEHPAENIECDEQRAFIFCKRQAAERFGKTTEECGDCYVFTEVDRDSKLLLCWHAGERGPNDTWTFTDKLFKAASGRPTINADGFTSRTSAITATFHGNCDYAQVVENFQNAGGNSAQVRNSPGSISSVTKTVNLGDVPESEIGTSCMEPFNRTTRMTLRRVTRFTYGFNKKTATMTRCLDCTSRCTAGAGST